MVVYPVPARNQLILYYDSDVEEKANVQIVDKLGRIVWEFKGLHLITGVNTQSLDIESIPAGVYIIQMDKGSGAESKTFGNFFC